MEQKLLQEIQSTSEDDQKDSSEEDASSEEKESENEGAAQEEREIYPQEFQKAVEDAIKDLRDQIARLSAAVSEAQHAVVMQPGYVPGMMMPMMYAHGGATEEQAHVELPRHPGAARAPVVCYGCGQPGHIRSRCTAARIQSNNGGGSENSQGYYARRLGRRRRRRGGWASRDIRRSREEVRVSTCRVVEPRAPEMVPLMSLVLEKKFVMPQWMEPPRKWGRPTSDKESCEVQRAMSVNVTESREAEPATKSDPPVEPTPSVTEALESPGEATAMSSEGDKSDPPADPTPSVTEVPGDVGRSGSEADESGDGRANEQGEQEWELPDWFKQRQMASMARHAERRAVECGWACGGFPWNLARSRPRASPLEEGVR